MTDEMDDLIRRAVAGEPAPGGIGENAAASPEQLAAAATAGLPAEHAHRVAGADAAAMAADAGGLANVLAEAGSPTPGLDGGARQDATPGPSTDARADQWIRDRATQLSNDR